MYKMQFGLSISIHIFFSWCFIARIWNCLYIFIFGIQNSISNILRRSLFLFLVFFSFFQLEWQQLMKLILGERQGQNSEQCPSVQCVLFCKEFGLNIRKSLFLLLDFICIYLKDLFPTVQRLQKAQFVRVYDVTSTHAPINI